MRRILQNLRAGYDAGRARRTGGESRALVPYANNRAVARSGLNQSQQWTLEQASYRERSPAEYQPGPRLIRRRLYSPQVRIETAHGTFYFKDYCEESEWSE